MLKISYLDVKFNAVDMIVKKILMVSNGPIPSINRIHVVNMNDVDEILNTRDCSLSVVACPMMAMCPIDEGDIEDGTF